MEQLEQLAAVDCASCRSLQGIKRVSPGPDIYTGRYWVVEHAYPTRYRGWLIMVLKRHAEALHDLTKEEFIELGEIQYKLVKAMEQGENVAKEYIMCHAETERFAHVHIHVVPKMTFTPDIFKGPNIFNLFKCPPDKALTPEEITAICEEYTARIAAIE